MYRIGVVGIPYDRGQSGISVYINEVVRELSKQHRLLIIMDRESIELFPVNSPNIDFLEIPSFYASPFRQMVWHTLLLPFLLKKMDLDFVLLSAANRRVSIFYPHFTIATVHDLSQFHLKGKYDSLRMFYVKKVLPLLLRSVDRFVSVSMNTKKDMVNFFSIPEKRIDVVHNGFRKRAAGKLSSSIDGEYILFVSRVEHPGKNHMRLIDAYGMLPKDLKDRYTLVFAGGLKERSEEVLLHAEGTGEKIVFTGFVDDEELGGLYENCSLFVYPSLYEGFGLPIIEAMSYGRPVLCSDRGSLPEVADNAALLCDPEDESDISGKMENLLTDVELRKKLGNLGLKRAESFSWESHAQRIVEIFEKSGRK